MATATANRVSVDYYGVQGTGRTVKEAKENAGHKLRAMIEADYTPRTVFFGGYTGIIWREPTGWQSRQFGPTEQSDGISQKFGCAMYGDEDPDEIAQGMLCHFIQVVCDVFAIRTAEDVPVCLTDKRKRADLVAWCRWQRAYQNAKQSLGMLDHEAHEWASFNAHAFQG